MDLHPDEQLLLRHSDSLIRDEIERTGDFALCAFAIGTDGNVVEVKPANVLGESSHPLTPLLGSLALMAQNGEIRASALCTPMTMKGVDIAVFDLERRGGRRLLTFMSYVKWLSGDWLFGEKEFREDILRVFGAL